jgi:hypothetical protein
MWRVACVAAGAAVFGAGLAAGAAGLGAVAGWAKLATGIAKAAAIAVAVIKRVSLIIFLLLLERDLRSQTTAETRSF